MKTLFATLFVIFCLTVQAQPPAEIQCTGATPAGEKIQLKASLSNSVCNPPEFGCGSKIETESEFVLITGANKYQGKLRSTISVYHYGEKLVLFGAEFNKPEAFVGFYMIHNTTFNGGADLSFYDFNVSKQVFIGKMQCTHTLDALYNDLNP